MYSIWSRDSSRAHPQVGALLHSVQAVDCHLGGGVDRQVGHRLPKHPQHPQILDQYRVHPHGAGLGGLLSGAGQLPVGEQGVQGEEHLDAPQMAIRNRRRSFIPGEVLRVAAGVEIPISQIDGVCPILHGGGDRLHGPGRGEKLQHKAPPVKIRPQAARPQGRGAPVPGGEPLSCAYLWFWSLKISRLASESSIFSLVASSRYSLIWRRRFSAAFCSLKY